MFVRLLDMESSSIVCIHVEKAEVLYHCHRLGHCTTVLNGVAARYSCIFHRILVLPCYYLLAQLMYYTKNITILLTHVRTCGYQGSFLILQSARERGYAHIPLLYTILIINFYNQNPTSRV